MANSRHTVEYRGYELTWFESGDVWRCFALDTEAKSFTALKEKVRKLSSQERQMACFDAVLVRSDSERWGVSDEGKTVKVSMVAHKDHGLPRDVWVMEDQPGNQPPRRVKKPIANLCLPTGQNLAKINEAKGLHRQAADLNKQANEVMKGVVRLTLEDVIKATAGYAGAE